MISFGGICGIITGFAHVIISDQIIKCKKSERDMSKPNVQLQYQKIDDKMNLIVKTVSYVKGFAHFSEIQK